MTSFIPWLLQSRQSQCGSRGISGGRCWAGPFHLLWLQKTTPLAGEKQSSPPSQWPSVCPSGLPRPGPKPHAHSCTSSCVCPSTACWPRWRWPLLDPEDVQLPPPPRAFAHAAPSARPPSQTLRPCSMSPPCTMHPTSLRPPSITHRVLCVTLLVNLTTYSYLGQRRAGPR